MPATEQPAAAANVANRSDADRALKRMTCMRGAEDRVAVSQACLQARLGHVVAAPNDSLRPTICGRLATTRRTVLRACPSVSGLYARHERLDAVRQRVQAGRGSEVIWHGAEQARIGE